VHGDDPPDLKCRAINPTRRRTISLIATALNDQQSKRGMIP
jgi:hypothetical protein